MSSGLDLDRDKCILTFIGPVGVGKSTQIALMKEYLRSRKIKVCTTFIKSSHILTHIIHWPLLQFGFYEEVSYQGNSIRICPPKRIFARLLSLWSFLDMISIATKFLFTVYIPLKLGYVVLIEEGPMMTLLTYREALPQLYNTRRKTPLMALTLLGWISRQNHMNIIFDADDRELTERRKSRSYRRNELPEYIALQRKWIEHLNLEETIFIETSGESVVGVHRKILSALEKLMRCRETKGSMEG